MAFKSKGVHILFVDDDEEVMKATSRLLRRHGYVVTGEIGSLEALRVFSDTPEDFDLAIIDHTMNGITGLELAKRFKRIQRGFPVILYGGDNDSSMLHDAEEAGISCSDRPTTGEEFESAIRQVLKV